MKRAWILVFLLMFAVPAMADTSTPGAPDRELIISSYSDGVSVIPVMGRSKSGESGGDRGTTGSGSGSMQRDQSRSGDTGTGTMQRDQSRSGDTGTGTMQKDQSRSGMPDKSQKSGSGMGSGSSSSGSGSMGSSSGSSGSSSSK